MNYNVDPFIFVGYHTDLQQAAAGVCADDHVQIVPQVHMHKVPVGVKHLVVAHAMLTGCVRDDRIHTATIRRTEILSYKYLSLQYILC